jgi:para-nitrobenzyl esterase
MLNVGQVPHSRISSTPTGSTRTTAVAEAHVGTGSDIQPMTACMMATWAAFARNGDPNNPTLPEWKPYTDADRHTMILNFDSRLAVDPGGEAQVALEELPYFGYSHSIEAFAKE